MITCTHTEKHMGDISLTIQHCEMSLLLRWIRLDEPTFRVTIVLQSSTKAKPTMIKWSTLVKMSLLLFHSIMPTRKNVISLLTGNLHRSHELLIRCYSIFMGILN